MARTVAHLLGTVGVLLTSLLWLSLLNVSKADRFVNSLSGSQNEYKIVLGAGFLAVVFAFAAAVRGARWWFIGLLFSVGTLGFFTYSLSH
ncbi:MAG TPA: hypothetical protein VMS18_27715 [Candidatus Binatia bacterium]|nr:hypothetical protein [Candidatus Binatia bacterium]